MCPFFPHYSVNAEGTPNTQGGRNAVGAKAYDPNDTGVHLIKDPNGSVRLSREDLTKIKPYKTTPLDLHDDTGNYANVAKAKGINNFNKANYVKEVQYYRIDEKVVEVHVVKHRITNEVLTDKAFFQNPGSFEKGQKIYLTK